MTNPSRIIAVFAAELLYEILVDCGSPGVPGRTSDQDLSSNHLNTPPEPF
jgi:hypothetical protein